MSDYEFTILMPCLNEEATIEYSIKEALEYISRKGLSAEILIADNESTDRSVDIARGLGARVIIVEQKGYGNALRQGILQARGKYIIMGDCDCSYDFSNLDGFVENLRAGYKLVMGNRYLGDIEPGAMPFSHKYIGIPFLSWLGRMRYKVKVGDFHCGIRGFDSDVAKQMRFSSEGMEFATELIGKFATNGNDIAEIPVVLRKDKRNGKSHLRSIPDGIRHLRYICSKNEKEEILNEKES